MDRSSDDRELLITVQGQKVIRAETPDQRTVFGEVTLPLLHRQLVEIFETWLGLDCIRREKETKAFGSLLFGILFGGEVYSLFDELRQKAGKGNRLRVELSFQGEAFDLAGFPWEFAYVPDTETRAGYFLSTDASLVLSRYIPLNQARQDSLQPSTGPLRILAVVSSPPGLDPVISDPVVKTIKDLAKEYPVEVKVLAAPTVDALTGQLDTFRPHVLHYLGHSRFNESQMQGEIALLADNKKEPRWVPDRLFAEFFRQLEAKPRLVILHSCEGGANEIQARFAGLAPQLVRIDIQAVVAMQYPITNRAAIMFSNAFYRRVASGAPVDDAVQAGRAELVRYPDYGYSNRVFGTPMLWMRSQTGLVLPKEKP